MNAVTRIVGRLAQLEVIRFGAIGTVAFFVDTATLYAVLATGLGFYAGRGVSYMVAVTFTWYGNRRITFAESRAYGVAATAREWLTFVAANSVGGVVNYATYAALVANVGLVRGYPVLGVAAGSLAGMTVNYTLSKFVVFRSKAEKS
ncbi:MAG TPA: GtrA family protein [Pseudomonadales bacterium]|nr:GtrA family protein [Pseudomonadales bacterium]